MAAAVAAHAVFELEQHEVVDAAARQRPRARQPRDAAADDDHIGALRARPATGVAPSRTRWPRWCDTPSHAPSQSIRSSRAQPPSAPASHGTPTPATSAARRVIDAPCPILPRRCAPAPGSTAGSAAAGTRAMSGGNCSKRRHAVDGEEAQAGRQCARRRPGPPARQHEAPLAEGRHVRVVRRGREADRLDRAHHGPDSCARASSGDVVCTTAKPPAARWLVDAARRSWWCRACRARSCSGRGSRSR